jgi:HK97 family phage prohead protease
MSERTIQIPATLYRTATFTREAMNEEERTIELSISSDEPYRRCFGDEILDHSPGSIDMARLLAGAPLLFNHDRDKHLGRIIEARTDGKKLRIKAKFGDNPLALEKWADIKSGILTDTSVGYSVSEMVLEKEEDGEATYRCTKWMPYEGSLVTIPADFTVGLGRNSDDSGQKILKIEKKGVDSAPNEEQNRNMPDGQQSKTSTSMSEPATPTVTVENERKSAIAAERERVKKINDFVGSIKFEPMKPKASELARKAIEEGVDFLDFKQDVLNNWETPAQVKTSPDIGMSEKDVKEFSLLRAIRNMATTGRLEGYEKEVCDAAQKQMKRTLTDARAFVLPEEVTRYYSAQDLQRALALSQRAQTVSPATAGGFLVQNQYGPLIEYLRKKTVHGTLAVTKISGLVG